MSTPKSVNQWLLSFLAIFFFKKNVLFFCQKKVNLSQVLSGMSNIPDEKQFDILATVEEKKTKEILTF